MGVKLFENNKAQASLEMAIFGSLILMALVTLFSYNQRLNDQQYAAMQAFREALRSSGGHGYVSYNVLDLRRQTAGDFFRKGSRAAISAYANVNWGKPDIYYDTVNKTIAADQPAPRYLWKINGLEYNLTEIYNTTDAEGNQAEANISMDTVYAQVSTEAMSKSDNSQGITTAYNLTLNDQATFTITNEANNKTRSITHYLSLDSASGKYKYDENAQSVSRREVWTTPR